jgi:glycosyltransferase involved in cell wall biosynthesis
VTQYEISVIVPTHNRRDLLAGLLASLAKQTYPADRWELIVVDDGSTDDTRALLDATARHWPTAFTTLHERNLRAAAARNAGAAEACGSVLLFLDDDMIAAPGLVAAHARCHVDPHLAVVGRIAAPPGPREPWTAWDDVQLDRFATALADGRHAPGPRDFYGGNCSVAADLFRSVGGYGTSIERGEDFDLGYRLAKAGARFAYCEAAESIHLGTHSFVNWVRNAAAFGRSEVALSREYGHRSDFFAWYRGRHKLNRLVVRLCSHYPALEAPLIAAMHGIGRLSHRLGATPLAIAAYSAIYNLSYWQGLIGAFGLDAFWQAATRGPEAKSRPSFR